MIAVVVGVAVVVAIKFIVTCCRTCCYVHCCFMLLYIVCVGCLGNLVPLVGLLLAV